MSETATIESTAKPISFAPAMVQAIREGRKTQTRRPVRIDPDGCYDVVGTRSIERYPHSAASILRDVRCPYGKPGDLLYVKERWCYDIRADRAGVVYQSDGEFCVAPDDAISDRIATLPNTGKRWNTHLPKWAARTFLRVTSVRVERLQDISSDDAIAEGIHPLPLQDAADSSAWWEAAPGKHQARSPVASYRSLWDSHNRAPGFDWASSPWVWVIGFEVIGGTR